MEIRRKILSLLEKYIRRTRTCIDAPGFDCCIFYTGIVMVKFPNLLAPYIENPLAICHAAGSDNFQINTVFIRTHSIVKLLPAAK